MQLENVCRIAMLPASIPSYCSGHGSVAVNTVNYTGCAHHPEHPLTKAHLVYQFVGCAFQQVQHPAG